MTTCMCNEEYCEGCVYARYNRDDYWDGTEFWYFDGCDCGHDDEEVDKDEFEEFGCPDKEWRLTKEDYEDIRADIRADAMYNRYEPYED